MQELQGQQGSRRLDWKKVDWRKWFRRDNLIVLVLTGILLFVIALPTKEGTDTGAELDERGAEAFVKKDGVPGEKTARLQEDTGEAWQAYAAEQEQKLKKMLSEMEGVGRVEVMLTISDSEELVVEKDCPISRAETREEDSQGGSRVVTQSDRRDSTVYSTTGGTSEPYVVKTKIPRVEGILVVAEGAGNGTVNTDITEIARALFGVEAHKVKVVRMETKER